MRQASIRTPADSNAQLSKAKAIECEPSMLGRC